MRLRGIIYIVYNGLESHILICSALVITSRIQSCDTYNPMKARYFSQIRKKTVNNNDALQVQGQ